MSLKINGMNGMYTACGYPTATSTEMLAWNNLSTIVTADTVLAASVAAGGSVFSVGLFQYDISCLQELCYGADALSINQFCHFVRPQHDGWMLGAYI